MGKELKPREIKVIKGIAEGKSTRRAMVDAGYSLATAISKGKKKVQELAPDIRKALEKQGVSVDFIAQTIKNAMLAKKEDPAEHTTRIKASEIACKMAGYIKEQEINNIVLEVVKFG